MAAAHGLLLLSYGPRVFQPRPESPSQMREAAWALVDMSLGTGNVDDENPGDSGDETTSLRSMSGSRNGEGESGASAGVVGGSQGTSSLPSEDKVRKTNGKKRKSPSPRKERSGPAKVPKVATTRSGRQTKESTRAREGREGS